MKAATGLLAAALVAAIWMIGLGDPALPPARPDSAASRPERDPAMAETLYQAAKSIADPDKAMVAVRKAMEFDGDHLGANVLLAELLMSQNDVSAAADQLAKAQKLLAGQADVPADLKKRLAAVEDRLAKACKVRPKWAAHKADFATQYADLGEQPSAVGLPSTATAFARACQLKPGDEPLAGRRDRAAALVPKLPFQHSEKPDAALGKILRDQAAGLFKAGKCDEAIAPLKACLAMNPNQPDALYDLASCYLRIDNKDPALAAVCLAEARRQSAELIDKADAERIAARVKGLMDLADSKIGKLETLNRQFADGCATLMKEAGLAGDKGLAEQIGATAFEVAGASISGPAKGSAIREGEWVNLLEFVNLKKDPVVYAEVYKWEGDALLSNAGSQAPPARLMFPYSIEGDYEFHATFEWPAKSKNVGIGFVLPVGATSVVLSIGESSSFLYDVLGKGGRDKDNPTVVKHDKPTKDRTYDLEVKVSLSGRNAKVESRLDKRPFVQWSGPVSALDIHDLGGFGVPNRKCVGLLSDPGGRETLFHKLDVRSTSGKIQGLRSFDPLVSGPGNLVNKLDLTARDIEIVTPAHIKVRPGKDHLVIQPVTDLWGLVQVTLGNLTFAHDFRLRLRVETGSSCGIAFGPSPHWGRSNYDLLCLSKASEQNKAEVGCKYLASDMKADGGTAWLPAEDKLHEAAREDGIYDVCFEKSGDVENVWVGATKVLEAKFPDTLLAEAKRMPMCLFIQMGHKQHDAKTTVTVTEFMLGKGIPAYAPLPASQPGD